MDKKNSIVLEAIGISKSFPGVKALDKVSVSFMLGEVHGVVGENGAGKSTLIKVISGAFQPDGGTVFIDGRRFSSLTPSLAQSQGIATVYQEQQLVPWLCVAENVFLGAEPRTPLKLVDHKRMALETEELIHTYGLHIKPKQIIQDIPIAARQEVAIIKAIHQKAKLLLLDEPTAALTGSQIQFLFDLIKNLRKKGMTVVYISHNLDEVLELAQRITVLRNGQCVGTFAAGSIIKEELIEKMTGHKLSTVTSRTKAVAEERILELRGVYFQEALADINLSVNKGEIVGLTGTVNSGYRELIRLIAGLLRPTKGSVALFEKPFSPKDVYEAIEKGVCFIPEDIRKLGLVLPLSLAKNITLANLKGVLQHGLINLKNERLSAQSYVNSLKIMTRSVDTEVRFLSGGTQRKVLFAKAMYANAKLLMLEEPTQGVDVEARQEIHRLLKDIKSLGKSIVVASSDVKELMEITDRIVALRKGQIAKEFHSSSTNPAELLSAILGD